LPTGPCLPRTDQSTPVASLENRLIVITGGGGGIGCATALLCAKRGDRVAILDKDGESAKHAAGEARGEAAGWRKAEDPAPIVAWLLSDETAYMIGSHVVCDGGILAKGSISV
jgi:nucleoside-diphosphate-sugar epimerase